MSVGTPAAVRTLQGQGNAASALLLLNFCELTCVCLCVMCVCPSVCVHVSLCVHVQARVVDAFDG